MQRLRVDAMKGTLPDSGGFCKRGNGGIFGAGRALLVRPPPAVPCEGIARPKEKSFDFGPLL